MSGVGPPGRDRLDDSGVALIVVLWLLVVLGAAAAEVGTSARFATRAAFNERCRLEAHYAARAGLADAAERLRRRSLASSEPLATRGRWDPQAAPAREGGVVVALDGRVGEASYRAVGVDISSRLNVNLAGEERLRSLLEATGVAADVAVRLSHAVLDWIDADDLRRAHGAEASDYLELGRERLPRNGPLGSIDELLHVRGMTPELLFGREGASGGEGRGGLSRFLTTRGAGRINLNSAPPEVLATLPGLTQPVVAVILDRRRVRPILSLDELLRDPRLSGDPRPRVADRLSRSLLAGLATEGVEVTATGVVPGCRVASRVEAELAVLPGRVVIGAWSEGWE